MEEQGNPVMVTLVLRDVVNLRLGERCLLGDGSSDWNVLLEKVSGERDVVSRYGEGIEQSLGEYVLGKLPDLPRMLPLLERLCEAVFDIKEKSRKRESCEADWKRLWTTLSSLETLYGKKFLIPRASLVSADPGATVAPPEEEQGGWKGPGRDDSDDLPRLGGVGVVV